MGKLQEMLELAYEGQQTEDNINQAYNNDKIRQLARSAIIEDKEVAGRFLVMKIIMLKSDEKQHKIYQRPPTTGQYFITANCTHTRVINLMVGGRLPGNFWN